ncbi:MAG TPA: hypothetical protein VGF97_06695 [Rhizomicrobium sp.]
MQFSGTLQGAYSYFDAPKSHQGAFYANGSALFALSDPGFNFQGNFNNANISAFSNSGDSWGAGGDVFWRDHAGTIGANATTHSIPGGDYLSFDGFGQWYASPEATVQIKGGWLSNRYDGPFASAGVVVYPMDLISLDLTADYAKANNLGTQLKDVGLTAEYLPVPDLPVSLAVSYSRSRIDGLPLGSQLHGVTDRNDDIFGVAVKLYLGGGGGGNTLRDYQRNGPVYWDGAPSNLLELAH